MNLKKAQKTVDDWINQYGVRYFNELTNMAILTEEVGEVAKIIARKYGEQSSKDDGWDSVLSILQMPGGVPVATVALNGSKNAGILAAQIIGSFDSKVSDKIKAYKKDLEDKVIESSNDLKKKA